MEHRSDFSWEQSENLVLTSPDSNGVQHRKGKTLVKRPVSFDDRNLSEQRRIGADELQGLGDEGARLMAQELVRNQRICERGKNWRKVSR